MFHNTNALTVLLAEHHFLDKAKNTASKDRYIFTN